MGLLANAGGLLAGLTYLFSGLGGYISSKLFDAELIDRHFKQRVKVKEVEEQHGYKDL